MQYWTDEHHQILKRESGRIYLLDRICIIVNCEYKGRFRLQRVLLAVRLLTAERHNIHTSNLWRRVYAMQEEFL